MSDDDGSVATTVLDTESEVDATVVPDAGPVVLPGSLYEPTLLVDATVPNVGPVAPPEGEFLVYEPTAAPGNSERFQTLELLLGLRVQMLGPLCWGAMRPRCYRCL